MKKLLKTKKNPIGSFKSIETFLYCILCCLTTSIFSQPELPCHHELTPVFPVPPATPLCDDYGNETFGYTFGTVGFENATQVISSIGSSTITGNIHIVADFAVTQSFTLLNCIVKIEPGVRITVSGFVQFTLDNSKLFACNDLWEGIHLAGFDRVETKNGTIIEDAEIAINAPIACRLSIVNTTFNRNVVGIELGGDPSNAIIPPIIEKFANNTFSCDSPLNGTVDGITFAGVKTNDTPASIGSLGAPSTFIGIEYGIYSQNASTFSTLIIKRCNFENILRDGIYMNKGGLDVQLCDFVNCGVNGINLSFASMLKVRACDFLFDNLLGEPAMGAPFNVNDYIGIFSDRFTIGCVVSIKSNDFKVNSNEEGKRVRGIVLDGGEAEVGAGTHILIFDNDFDFELNVINAGNGLILTGDFNSNSTTEINNNSFHLLSPEVSSGGNAININSGNKNNLSILGNHFYGFEIPDNNKPQCVGLFGSLLGENNDFTSNTFHLQANPQNLDEAKETDIREGVHAQIFSNMNYCENNFANTAYAMSFLLSNMGTGFSRNDFTSVAQALTITGGFIDPQEHKGNTWSPYYYDDGTNVYLLTANYHAYCDPPQNAELSKFEVHTPQGTIFHPILVIPDTQDEFFEQTPGSPSSACANLIIGDDPTKVQKELADRNMGQYGLDSAIIWGSEIYLYKLLVENPSHVTKHSSFAGFVTTKANTTVGKFYDVYDLIEQASEADSEMLDGVAGYNLNKLILIDSLGIIDSLLNITENVGELDQLSSQKENILNDIQELDSLINDVQIIYEQDQLNVLSSALTLNDGIQTLYVYETNLKKVNDILLRSALYQDGELTVTQISELQAIALQCPKEGGIGTYYADGVLPGCEKVYVNHFTPTCFGEFPSGADTVQYFLQPTGEATQSTNGIIGSGKYEIVLFPNPATNEVNISLPAGEKGRIRVFNSTGKLVKSKPFGKIGLSTMKLPSTWPEGVYTCEVLFESGFTKAVKFLVVK